MKNSVIMNGTDYLMSVFDNHLRRVGASGNTSHICLALSHDPGVAAMEDRVRAFAARYPIVSARQGRLFFSRQPCWRIPVAARVRPPLVVLCTPGPSWGASMAEMRKAALNQPLDVRRGELMRFFLLREGDDVEVIMTWTHSLMDAHGAEATLSLIANGDAFEPASETDSMDDYGPRKVFPCAPLGREIKGVWRAMRLFERVGGRPPASLFTARKESARPVQDSRFITFSEDETTSIHENITSRCGFLGETRYLMAATLITMNEFNRTHGIAVDNYVINLPVDGRSKGDTAPLFSNFSSFILYGMSPESLVDMTTATEEIQRQTRAYVKEGTGFEFDSFLWLSRRLPRRIYWHRMRLAMGGEIGSFFFANPGQAKPEIRTFLGADVLHMRHATSVTCPPGLGVFFHRFKGRLCCTLSFVEGIFNTSECELFAARLRENLLYPGA